MISRHIGREIVNIVIFKTIGCHVNTREETALNKSICKQENEKPLYSAFRNSIQTLHCILKQLMTAYAWGGLNTKTPEVCPLQKGEGIRECRKLVVSFLESVFYRHNFEVLI